MIKQTFFYERIESGVAITFGKVKLFDSIYILFVRSTTFPLILDCSFFLPVVLFD